MPENVIPVICGPTASGKTALALELAKNYPIEVISADSRQVIRHLDIGTAKPTTEEQSIVRFHLINLIEPGERYSAMRFLSDAGLAIKDIRDRNNWPLVVGGTGLYLSALVNGIIEIGEEDLALKERLVDDYANYGPERMWERLKSIDPLEAAKVHPNHKSRLLRALEIYELTGKPKTELIAQGTYKKSKDKFVTLCLLPDKQQLYQTIDLRVETMLSQGLLNEVKLLVNQGLSDKVRRAHVIGYDELIEHLAGRTSFDEAVSLIKQNTRRFAKRQITWFKNQFKGEFFGQYEGVRDHFERLKSQ